MPEPLECVTASLPIHVPVKPNNARGSFHHKFCIFKKCFRRAHFSAIGSRPLFENCFRECRAARSLRGFAGPNLWVCDTLC